MINTIRQLRKNHQNFDVLWNKIGTEVQKDLVKNAPELLTALGAWYNRSNELLLELEEQIEQAALEDSADDILQDDEDEEYEEDEEEDEEDDEDEQPLEEDFGRPRPGVNLKL